MLIILIPGLIINVETIGANDAIVFSLCLMLMVILLAVFLFTRQIRGKLNLITVIKLAVGLVITFTPFISFNLFLTLFPLLLAHTYSDIEFINTIATNFNDELPVVKKMQNSSYPVYTGKLVRSLEYKNFNSLGEGDIVKTIWGAFTLSRYDTEGKHLLVNV